jgi:hypothetical protein
VTHVPDTRTGAGVLAALPDGGLVRLRVHLPPDASDLTGLRMLLVADVLARAAELRGMQAATTWASADQAAAREVSAAVLNIHPPARQVGLEPAASEADVHVTACTRIGDGAEHVTVHGAAEVTVARAYLPDTGSPAAGAGDALAGRDPLALRLVLLSVPLDEAVGITPDMLANAEATLAGWRNRVAVWAESPSRPVPGPVMASLRTAARQLDTVATLITLRTVATDSEMASGAKFETFLYADRVLGLDLPDQIGRLG